MLCFIWLPQFSCSLGQRVVSKHGNPRHHATGKEEEGSEIGLRLPTAPSLGALGTSLCVLNPSRGPPKSPPIQAGQRHGERMPLLRGVCYQTQVHVQDAL